MYLVALIEARIRGVTVGLSVIVWESVPGAKSCGHLIWLKLGTYVGCDEIFQKPLWLTSLTFSFGVPCPCEVPSPPIPTTGKGWPHHEGLRPLLFSNSDVGSFTSHKNKSVKVLWDGTYGFSSLSEKTRKSNHLQMSLQRQHFLLSYLKNLSVAPAGVWTATWANQAAVIAIF